MDRSNETVFNRYQDEFRQAFLETCEQRLEGAARHELDLSSEQLERSILAERSWLTLKSHSGWT